MALIMKYIDSMHHYMDKYSDPRTRDWPLMSSPLPTLALCLGYVYLVKVLGPRLMENRKPFQLKNTLIVYNFVQVVFSAWLFYECLMGGWWGEYSFRCQPVDHGTTGRAMRVSVAEATPTHVQPTIPQVQIFPANQIRSPILPTAKKSGPNWLPTAPSTVSGYYPLNFDSSLVVSSSCPALLSRSLCPLPIAPHR